MSCHLEKLRKDCDCRIRPNCIEGNNGRKHYQTYMISSGNSVWDTTFINNSTLDREIYLKHYLYRLEIVLVNPWFKSFLTLKSYFSWILYTYQILTIISNSVPLFYHNNAISVEKIRNVLIDIYVWETWSGLLINWRWISYQ